MPISSSCRRSRSRRWTSLWLLAVHAVALYVFTTGFFLTRFEVPDVSSCRAEAHGRLRSDAPGDPKPTDCWMPARYRRVVFVVIDALRFDFVQSPSGSSPASATGQASFFLNRLPVLNATLHDQPRHSLLLRFVADPPTMTMQRLKGLTTGSLPTFLDIKDNMASSEIAEDNLLKQMHALQRPIVFMGDDTWQSLYAKLFTRTYAFESFNVKDLDSVDNGVVKHLFPELKQQDWGLLIAHFLGVDHVGHTHGPSSPHMTRKLDEMNAVLERLLEELPGDDTLLAVMGDHGMSADGNHGGASDDETGAALFLFSKQPLVHGNRADWPNEVPQVDLVPTLALLSGLPIPFGNLGSIIPQLFFFPSSPDKETAENDSVSAFETLNQALALNVAQVRTYLLTYSSASKLPETEYEHLEAMHSQIHDLRQRYAAQHDALTTDSERLKQQEELAEAHQEYLRQALALGRSIWTQFDLVSMAWGVMLLLWALIAMLVVLLADSEGYFFIRSSLLGLITGWFIPSGPFLPSSTLSRSLVLAAGFGMIEVSSHLVLLASNSASKASAMVFLRQLGSSTLVAFVVVLLHLLALLSNSYIVAEDRVMHFLSMTVGFFLLWRSYRLPQRNVRQFALLAGACFVVAARVASGIDPPNIIQSSVTASRTLLPLVMTLLVSSGSLYYFGSNAKMSTAQRYMCVSIPLSYVCCALYWIYSPIEIQAWRLWLPRFVYLAVISSLLLVGFQARRYRLYSTQDGEATWHTTVDCVMLGIQLLPAYALTLGPTSPISLLCLVVQSASFAAVSFSVHRSVAPISWLLLWSSVGYHSFFFTGHQNTFTSLQNAAAFVGFDDFHFYFAGALLGLNTFGNYALASLCALPLLAVAPSQSFSNPQTRHHDPRWWRCVLAITAYFALNAVVSTIFVALQRRHLMVWAIFAPKFIFDGITLLVLELLLLLLSLHCGSSFPKLK